MRYRPSMRADLISADGADAIASVLRTMMRGGAGSVEEGEVALQTVLQLAVELTAGDAAVQDVLRECGCLAELVDVLVAQEVEEVLVVHAPALAADLLLCEWLKWNVPALEACTESSARRRCSF